MSQTANKPNPKDAVSLLTRDHKEVKSAFKQFETLGDRAFVAKKKLAEDICSALTVHAAVEEEIFYPAVRKHVKESGDMLDEAAVEHASAKDLIAQIQMMSSEDDLFDAKVKVLSEQIEHHAGEEEEEMFAKVRKSNMDLMALGEEIAARKAELLTAVPASWPYGSLQSNSSSQQDAR
ncbi:hemerythrin domain-containing protein [soil metagenome]